jgi:hypothetical protein
MMESLLRAADDQREAELEPDILLPSQLGDGLFGAARLQPEKRLQLAVLEDAILTFERSVGVDRPRPRRLLAEVDAWFASDATDSPFAFVTICHTLNIDPDYVRGGLRRRRTRLEATTQRKPPLRRDGNGTRHQVVFYVTPRRRIA